MRAARNIIRFRLGCTLSVLVLSRIRTKHYKRKPRGYTSDITNNSGRDLDINICVDNPLILVE